MRTVLVPQQPGLAAAWGLLVADVTRDFVAPLGIVDDALNLTRIESVLSDLRARAHNWCKAEGTMSGAWQITAKLDLRYAGMTHETTIECPDRVDLRQAITGTIDRFHDHFEQLSGRSWRDREAVEIVNLRLTASGRRRQFDLPRQVLNQESSQSPRTMRDVEFLGTAGPQRTPIYDRDRIDPMIPLYGPSIIEQYESTTVLPNRWAARIDELGNMILEHI